MPLLGGSHTLSSIVARVLNNPVVSGKTLSIPRASDGGITIDGTWGYQDVHANLTVKTTGASDPAFAVYRGGIRQFQFAAAAMNELYIGFDVPHDYVPGTDVSFHVHWSNAAAVPNTGVVRWGFEWMWALAFSAGAFSAPASIYAEQASHAVQYTHVVTGTAGLGLGASLGVGAIIIARFHRDAAHANDTCTDAVFAHEVNLHYQSKVIGTKNDAPPFYT